MVAVLWRCRCGRLFLGGVGSGAVWPDGCCRLCSLAMSARWAGCLKPRSPLRLLAEPQLKPPSPLRAPAEPQLKPRSPLRAPAEPRLKPPSPLRARNGCFWCSFRAQRRCRFQRSLVGGAQWCCWFQCRHVVAPCARKSSPSALTMAQKWRFLECWASFFAEMLLNGPCWASFFADRQSWDPTGRTLSRRSPGRRPFYWQC